MDLQSFIPSIKRAILALSLLGLYYVFRKIQQVATARRFQKLYGCEEPAKWPQKDAWGSDLIAARAKAIQQGRLYESYGDDFARLGRTFQESPRGEKTVVTTDPVNFKAVLAAQDYENHAFGKPLSSRYMTYPFLGNSIANDGRHHKRLKTLLKPIFAQAERMDTIRIQTLCETFMELLPKPGVVFDAQPLLIRLFTDVSTDFIFGANVNSMQDEEGGIEFVDAYMTVLTWMRIRRMAGWTAFRYNWNKEYLTACATVHKFVDKAVARALRNVEKGVALERYTLADGLARDFKDPIDLRSQLLGMLLPARDNYYIFMGGILFELARHPQHWTRLREIALSDEAQRSSSYEIFRSPHFDEIRYVVLESLRLNGPAGHMLREAKRDTILPCGGGLNQDKPVFVAKGTKVHLYNRCIMKEAEIWGDDVLKFRPERWRNWKPAEWEWTPYGGGFRLCPAENYATIQVMYILVQLLRRYEGIENHDPEEKYVEEMKWLYESRNGVKIAFR